MLSFPHKTRNVSKLSVTFATHTHTHTHSTFSSSYMSSLCCSLPIQQKRNLLYSWSCTQHLAHTMAFAPIYNPSVPFHSTVLGGMSDGKTVTIQGQVRMIAKRFAVNFMTFNNDIAFHFNPRFDEGNAMVCNTQQAGGWGAEERKSKMPFRKNTNFNLVFTVRVHGFQVSANGQFILEYRHRIAFQSIQSIQVTGDVNLSCVTFSGGMAAGMAPGIAMAPSMLPSMAPSLAMPPAFVSPMVPVTIPNPMVPFQSTLQGTFAQNRNIIINGTIRHGADRFHVNLLNSLSRSIYLHINPRFREGALVRNTQDRGTWGPEERHLAFMPFSPGQNFQLEIRNEGGSFGVYTNGAKIFSYVHRLPVLQIDMIEVAGDVTLSYVQL
uniref:Galectin n=1 Tax=Leptobrachium leishanense TaxID=445787 RepID=A0A8C5Q4W8_9ANUR